MLAPCLQFNNTECIMQSKALVSCIQSGVFRLNDRRLRSHQFRTVLGLSGHQTCQTRPKINSATFVVNSDGWATLNRKKAPYPTFNFEILVASSRSRQKCKATLHIRQTQRSFEPSLFTRTYHKMEDDKQIVSLSYFRQRRLRTDTIHLFTTFRLH